MGDAGELELREGFAGPWALGAVTPRVGAIRGAMDATRMLVELTLDVEDVSACIADAGHRVRVRGHVQIDGLLARGPLAGEARLYVADPALGIKRCEYRLRADAADGTVLCVEATAFVRPGRATRAERGTLYVRVRSAARPAIVIGAGVIRRRARHRWRAAGMRTPAHVRWRQFVRREIATPMPPLAS